MARYRYSRWDGTQNTFGLTEEEIIDSLSDDVLARGDLSRALRELMRRGIDGQSGDRVMGLRDLAEQLKQRRSEQLERHNLDSVMKDIEEKLEDIVNTERRGIDRRLEEARKQATEEDLGQKPNADELSKLLKYLQQRVDTKREQLDNLPESPAGRFRELSEYEFMDSEAQQKFQELTDQLKKQMLQNHFQSMKEQLRNLNSSDLEPARQMLRDMNQLLQQHMQGQTPDFQDFMNRHGAFFGSNPPENLEELLDHLGKQIAQAQSLMNSLSDEQRQELEDLMDSSLDPEIAQELAELSMALQQILPMEGLIKEYQFVGDEPVDMGKAMDLMNQLQNLDQLEQRIEEISRRGNIDDLDLGQIEELLGQEARNNVEKLQQLTRALEESGYLRQNKGRLELTPQGIRRIAQKALKDVFVHLNKDRIGQHEIHSLGAGGESSGETKPYEFGDQFEIDLQETVLNGVFRNGSGIPVHLNSDDFHVHRTEQVVQAATVLLLDQSRSMGLYGSFFAAKKVAMALSALIQSRFPRDYFYVVGFSDYAVELKQDELPEVSWNDWVSGTNMHHALMLSRKLLSKFKGGTRQILMITDGEPTTHLERGQALFSYPPSHRTIEETLKEVKRCTRERITINTFMLETSSYLLAFIDKMTRINKGRAFYTNPEKLGEYVLVDYLSGRKQRVV